MNTPLMRRRLCATSIAVVIVALSVPGQSQSPNNLRLERLKQWITLGAEHQPGQLDTSVEGVQFWTSEHLRDVRDDLYAIRRLICAGSVREPEASRPTCTPPATNVRGGILRDTTVGHRTPASAREWVGMYTVNHLRDLSELAADIDRRDINEVLKRGALLHTDIALRTPPLVTWSARPIEGFLTRTTVHVVDGRQSGVDYSVDHLAMARRLLDIVTPDPRRDSFTYPERDDTVRDWYRATMAVLLSEQGVFLSHQKAALELFRDDEEVLFQAGALHETLAAPHYQQGVTTRRLAAVSFLESGADELRRAEQLFRQALKVNPRHVEARLRLGQVLGQLRRSAEALVELRRVQTESRDPLLSFYTELFIGREEGSVNHVEAARVAYQRAADLFPRAQSPRIALSELHMRSGNRLEAARALDVVWGWGTSREDADDPWSNYLNSAGRAGGSQLDAIGAAFSPLSATR